MHLRAVDRHRSPSGCVVPARLRVRSSRKASRCSTPTPHTSIPCSWRTDPTRARRMRCPPSRLLMMAVRLAERGAARTAPPLLPHRWPPSARRASTPCAVLSHERQLLTGLQRRRHVVQHLLRRGSCGGDSPPTSVRGTNQSSLSSSKARSISALSSPAATGFIGAGEAGVEPSCARRTVAAPERAGAHREQKSPFGVERRVFSVSRD